MLCDIYSFVHSQDNEIAVIVIIRDCTVRDSI